MFLTADELSDIDRSRSVRQTSRSKRWVADLIRLICDLEYEDGDHMKLLSNQSLEGIAGNVLIGRAHGTEMWGIKRESAIASLVPFEDQKR